VSSEWVKYYDGFLATTNDLIALERATAFKSGVNVQRTLVRKGPPE